MYSAAFIFKPGQYDDEFYRLNALIDAAAEATEGFVGSETWRSPDGSIVNATYYWESLDALQRFSRDSKHVEAKGQVSRWYDGYHVVISQVIRAYGDDRLEHLVPSERVSRSR